MTTDTVTTKRCPDCGVVKLLDDFYVHRGHSDGRNTYCKSCSTARTLDNQARNRQARTDYQRQWRARNPGAQQLGRAQADAYKAAEARLRETHRAEFDRYYAEERDARGLRT